MRVFVQKLEEKRDGKSLRRFAAELGVSHSLLSHIVRGTRQPGPRLIDAVLALYPEMAYYLAVDAQQQREVV